MTLLSVVLGTSSATQRDSSSLALLQWGFGHFAPRTLVRAGQVVARPRVRHRSGVTVPVLAATTVRRVLARGEPVQTRADVASVLSGPLPQGARVGRLTILAGGRAVGSVPLVLARSLARYEPPRFWVARMAIPITLVSALLLAAWLAWFARRDARASGAEGRRGR
jgi:D-alanyl-D-alanine carboxypeptidase (penicillin-binding protein 5/6)